MIASPFDLVSRRLPAVALGVLALIAGGCPDDGRHGDDDAGSATDTSTLDAATPPDSSPETDIEGDTGGGGDTDVSQAGVGLDERPTNTTCTAPDRPAEEADIELTRAFENLDISDPVWMQQAPDDEERWYLVEQPGRIVSFEDRADVSETRTFVDLTDRVRSGGERGLLGMAFHPDWPETRRVFVSYTTEQPGTLTSRISSFETTDGGDRLDETSETLVLSLEQPYGNHNGGQITFGPDGYLYAGFGDGGAGGDPHGHGQNPETLLGTILRLDVTGGSPYAIPPDNPFADGDGGAPEVYAWGLRNPWRFSFDRESGELWVGDVGQNAWEEISLVEKGGNYGWSAKEGTHCYDRDPCEEGPWIDPVVEYPHEEGRSVTGGYVYRGEAIPELAGTYLFGDFPEGKIWGLFYDPETGDPEKRLLAETSQRISSFARGPDGELYTLDYRGDVWRIEPPDQSDSEGTFPGRLSETGCLDPEAPTEPADGLIPYTVNAPFWSDGAGKERYLALPEGETIATGGEAGWELPVGSVLVKSFLVDGAFVETRLLVRHEDGNWAGYSYAWNEAQTEANLLEAGRTRQLGDREWVYPSRSDCLSCHTDAAGGTLGLETGQLNGPHDYEATGRRANQLVTLDHIGLFSEPLFAEGTSPDPQSRPRLPDPFGSAPREERARAYLETNCAQCHRPGTGLRTEFDARWQTPAGERGLCEQPPVAGDLGVEGARLVTPGEPSTSLVSLRAGRRDANGMPPLASRRVDSRGVDLLDSWIASGQACP